MHAATPGVILKVSVSSANKRCWRRGSESGDEKQKDNNNGATEQPWICFCKSPMQSQVLEAMELASFHAHANPSPYSHQKTTREWEMLLLL